ncbi:MAG: hypothetical protein ACR2MD_19715 [Aridibacter sp.]
MGSDTISKSDKGRRFVGEIAAEYELKAVITLPKNAYYKYGTNFHTCIICIRKPERLVGEDNCSQRQIVLEANCQNLEDCLSFINIFD